jgi:hypothetical protein
MSSGSTDLRGSRRSPSALLASRTWRWRHSVWLLGPIVGLSMLTWASFLYVGAKARRRDWLAAAVLYGIALGAGMYLTNVSQGSDAATDDWGGVLLLFTWVGGMVHALSSNRAWLRWCAAHSSPWYTDPAPAPSAPGGTPSAAPTGYAPLGVDASQFYASPPPAPPAPLDVNRATEAELLRLPGMTPERVQQVVSARSARRGFGSVEQFAAAAGLAPHEHARVRPWVTCAVAPMTTPQPGSGRVVDF